MNFRNVVSWFFFRTIDDTYFASPIIPNGFVINVLLDGEDARKKYAQFGSL